MNYLAHAVPFLDDAYLVAGTGVPDWLSVVDRRVRMRLRRVEPFLGDCDRRTAAVARGVCQHLRDDLRFHQSRAFAELSLGLAVAARDILGGDAGFRPGFLGHLLVEVLLDASLAAENPAWVEAYYAALESVDADFVQQVIGRMAARDCPRLAAMIRGFCRERILPDYLEDAKLLGRLNQVMRRVQLAELPDSFRDFLPEARQLVAARKHELLAGIPA